MIFQIIKFYPSRVLVLCHSQFNTEVSIRIENKTLTKLIGKVVDENGETLIYFAIDSQKNYTDGLKMKKGKKYSFVPLSPAFQEVPLEIGAKPIEIPPRS